MRLLLDLGNTRVKWAFADGDQPVRDTQAMAWCEDVTARLVQAWAGDPRPQAVLAASVVAPPREAALEQAVQTAFALPVTWVHTPRAAGGVRNAYAQPENLGVDRFLGLLAAYREGRAPCVLVSCGTALVLDALAADGQHLGGLIAPGPRLMQQALCQATGIQSSVAGQVVEMATDTADAVTSGAWQACAALADRFALRAGERLGANVQVLLGGGDAPVLQPLLAHRVAPFPDAVLRGLALWPDRTD